MNPNEKTVGGKGPAEKNFSEASKNVSVRDFVKFYLYLGDPGEAALRAGADAESALEIGLGLLEDKKVRKMLKKAAQNGGADIVGAGLRRLAFGRINDALELLKEDGPGEGIGKLDLYSVSEIKKVKGGGVEIKFFDRLEALQKLAELEETLSGNARADDMLRALSGAALD